MSITLDGNNANTVGVINSATAQNATGTAVNFTGIPAGIKRITVMFNGVSVSGSSILVQAGTSGGVVSSGYTSVCTIVTGSSSAATSTAGFLITSGNTVFVLSGAVTLCNVSGNIWECTGMLGNVVSTAYIASTAGVNSLSGVLDRVRITTVSGTDTFDAGSINIIYE